MLDSIERFFFIFLIAEGSHSNFKIICKIGINKKRNKIYVFKEKNLKTKFQDKRIEEYHCCFFMFIPFSCEPKCEYICVMEVLSLWNIYPSWIL